MTKEEIKRERAKGLRYKKPLATCMNLAYIREILDEISEASYDIRWMDDDDIAALLDDEEEAYEFRMAFSDLSAEAERFYNDLEEEWVPECFDDLFPAAHYSMDGYIGYDAFEGDYYGLSSLSGSFGEEEARKRLCRLTKAEMLDATGQCLKIYRAFVGLQYRYDCLKSSLDILRGEHMETLRMVKGIEEIYEDADGFGFERYYNPYVHKMDELLQALPKECWL